MPFPALFVLVGAGMVGAKGAQKMVRGVGHLNDARGIAERSQQLSEATQRQLERRDQALLERIARFAEHRQTVQLTSLTRFAQLYERQSLRMKLTEKEFAARFSLPEAQARELKATARFTMDLANAALGAGTVATVASQLGTALAMKVGVTSAGTALGTLSGAAATNATLAWLGGGSLAAGGGGMAMGTMVLGGLAAAPAMVVVGYGVAKKGEQALSAALEFEADVLRYRAEARMRWTLQNAVERRMDELTDVLESTRVRLDAAVARCEREEARLDGAVHDRSFNEALLLAQAVSALLKTNVHDEAGQLIQTPLPATTTPPVEDTEPTEPVDRALEWSDEIEVLQLHEGWANSAVLDANDVLYANVDGRLLEWDFEDDDLEALDHGVKVGTVTHLLAHRKQDLLMGAREGRPLLRITGTLEQWTKVEEIPTDGSRVVATAFARWRPHLIVACEERLVGFNLETDEGLWEVPTPTTSTRVLAMHPKDHAFALGSYDGSLHLMDAQTGEIRWATRHDGACHDVAFSPDGQYLLTASDDKTARLWSAETGEDLHQFRFGERYADRVAFSGDGKLLAVGFANGTVGLWEVETRELVNLFSSGKGRVTALGFSQGTDLLMVAGEGGVRVCLPKGPGEA